MLIAMSDLTQILNAVEQGDAHAAEQLWPLIYDALRNLAAQKLAQESPGQTLQANDLLHEAYLRLKDTEQAQHWDSRRHFFAAAAEAMRRILVDTARRKRSQKCGGGAVRHDMDGISVAAPHVPEEILALCEALEKLAEVDQQAAELVKLRYFSGLTLSEAAEVLQVSPRTTNNLWAYARAWLLEQLEGDSP